MPLCLSGHNHMLSDVPREAKCGLWMHQHSLGARPLAPPVRPGANTLPQKWSLGQSKCQVCVVKPMSQCWRGTQGRREASKQTTPSIWITSSDFSSSSKFCLSVCLCFVSLLLRAGGARGYSLSIKLTVSNWHSPVGRRDRQHLTVGIETVRPFWQPGSDRTNSWGPSALPDHLLPSNH